MAKEHRFCVVGIGPTGGTMAAYLANAGQPVVVVDKLKSHVDAVKEHGLTITGFREMEAHFTPEDVCYSIDDLIHKPVDIVFVATKASVMAGVMPQLQGVLKPGTTVISLQNGMDTEAILAKTFGAENVMRVVVNYAGFLVEDGKIQYSFFNPPNYIGVIDPSKQAAAEEIAEILTEAELDTKFAHDIRKRVWVKVILNCGLSAICAITRKTMKQMMDCEATRKLVEDVLREATDVARASGVDLPENFFDTAIDYLSRAGHHRTSMHIDIIRENPAEIDFINGKVVEYGRKKHLATPFNRAIVSLIKGTQLGILDPEDEPQNAARIKGSS
jgi:2-dehydropantoate 2-reductase